MRTLIILFLSVTAAMAAPFLTANPYAPVATGGDPKTAVASFNLFFDGASAAISTPAVIDASGNQILHYDLSTLSSATHTVTAAAVNQYGNSSAQSAPFTFSLATPAVPTGLSVSPK